MLRTAKSNLFISWLKDISGRITLRRSNEQSPETRPDALSDRLLAHLHDYEELLQVGSIITVEADRNGQAYQLAAEARSFAFEVSLIPGFSTNPILRQAHQALLRHWNCSWTNGKVSETQYRLALKSVAVYLRNAPSAQSVSFTPQLSTHQ